MPTKPDDNPDEDTTTPDAAAIVDGLTSGFADGEVVFTVPGIESKTFTAKGGKIVTNKAGREWLATNAAGTPVAD